MFFNAFKVTLGCLKKSRHEVCIENKGILRSCDASIDSQFDLGHLFDVMTVRMITKDIYPTDKFLSFYINRCLTKNSFKIGIENFSPICNLGIIFFNYILICT